jgi:hypothetical protein
MKVLPSTQAQMACGLHRRVQKGAGNEARKFVSHSSLVKIRLLLDGHSIDVAQLGPDCLFVDSPMDAPPGEATIMLNVDQAERRWRVRLAEGISSRSEKIVIAAAIP